MIIKRNSNFKSQQIFAGIFFFLICLIVSSIGNAGETLPLPISAPHYDIDLQIIPESGTVWVDQTIFWTNPTDKHLNDFILTVYPHRKYTDRELNILRGIASNFRVDYDNAIPRSNDPEIFTLVGLDSMHGSLPWEWVGKSELYLKIHVDPAIKPGETFDITLRFRLDLPELWGRLGNVNGVISLDHWYPVVTWIDEGGWRMDPFVVWHQPTEMEAASYDIFATLPQNQKVASTGLITDVQNFPEDGLKVLKIESDAARTFSLVCSEKYAIQSKLVGDILVKSFTLPDHKDFGNLAIETAGETLAYYEEKFGPYGEVEFEVVESYLGYGGKRKSQQISAGI